MPSIEELLTAATGRRKGNLCDVRLFRLPDGEWQAKVSWDGDGGRHITCDGTAPASILATVLAAGPEARSAGERDAAGLVQAEMRNEPSSTQQSPPVFD